MSSIDDLLEMCILNDAQLYQDDEGYILLTDRLSPENSCCLRVDEKETLYIWISHFDYYEPANFKMPNNYKEIIIKQKRLYSWN